MREFSKKVSLKEDLMMRVLEKKDLPYSEERTLCYTHSLVFFAVGLCFPTCFFFVDYAEVSELLAEA